MTSPMPFIKNEPDDQTFNFNSYGSFGAANNQFGGWQSQSLPNGDVGGDTSGSSLTRPAMGSQQNLSSNFIAGSSMLNDDDLAADFLDFDTGSKMQQARSTLNTSTNFANTQPQSLGPSSGFLNGSQNQNQPFHSNQQSQSYLQQMFSNTPPGNGPIQSPFTGNFNYSQWSSLPSQPARLQAHQRQSSPSLLRNGSNPGAGVRRNDSSARTRLSPTSANAQPATSDPQNFDTHAIPVAQDNSAHRQNGSSQWESGLGSANSFIDSPALSPLAAPAHRPMSSVMASNNYASFSAKQENPVPSSLPTTAAEAKKRRRRESHNAVERRRRDNINDRIGQLSNLVPVYRLDDDRIRKHPGVGLGGAPSSLGSGMSPPNSTSLGTAARRTPGSITQGLPIDDKDKNPAKGDVLNGAVTWTRDLMWLLYRKIQQESILIEHIQGLGSQPPLEFREDEQRMQSELLAAIERNGGSDSFDYSRSDGTGLYVPNHTNNSGGRLSSDSVPEFDSNLPHSALESNYGNSDTFPWDFTTNNDSARNSLELKEEDEFGMDMS